MTFARLWTFLAVALPVLAGLLASMSTVDLAYHLRAGNEFMANGTIPVRDTWTHTAAGQPWQNQQWGAQVLFALVHRIGGFELLVVLRAALIGGIFGLILLAVRLRGTSARTAALLTLGAFALSAAALGLRPQLFGMLLFAATLVIVTDRHRNPGRLWVVPALVVLWANLHGSFFLGPLVLGIAWLEDRHDRRPGSARLLVASLAAAAASVVNPFGIGVWSYAVGLSTNPEVTSKISEWQPTTLRTPLGIAFFVSALAVAALLARRPRLTPWPTMLWLAILFLIGAYAVRGVAWWPLGAAVVVAGLLVASATDVRAERASPLNTVLAAVLVVAGIVLLPWWRPADPWTGRAGLLLDAPGELTGALQEAAAPGARLFHPQAWGSWLEYAAPQMRTFVDARIELFPPAVWDDYATIVDGREGWREVLDRYAIDAVVADARISALGDRLAADPAWRLSFDGEGGRVFVRAP